MAKPQIVQFTIKGNQEDPLGNPMAYFRTTQGSQFTKGAKRYHAWGDYVRAQLIDALARMKDRREYAEHFDFSKKKPIKASSLKQKMTLRIFFKDKTHADSDNIFKGIADALFMNDKYLASDGFDYFYTDKDTGGSVTITLEL